MSSIFVREAMNIFPGDSGNDRSKHLSIANLSIPTLEEKTADHMAGGAIGALEIGGLGINALQVGFKLMGSDAQSMGLFGIGGRNQVPYTMYGLIRDKNGNKPLEMKAIVWGRMTKMAPSEFKRGDLDEQDHEIKEVTHYELYYNKAEKYYFDFFSSAWRVDGVDQNSDLNSILRIS